MDLTFRRITLADLRARAGARFTPSKVTVETALRAARAANARDTTPVRLDAEDALAVLAHAEDVIEAVDLTSVRMWRDGAARASVERHAYRHLADQAMSRSLSLVGPVARYVEWNPGLGERWVPLTDDVDGSEVVRVRLVCPARPMLSAHTGEPHVEVAV